MFLVLCFSVVAIVVVDNDGFSIDRQGIVLRYNRATPDIVTMCSTYLVRTLVQWDVVAISVKGLEVLALMLELCA